MLKRILLWIAFLCVPFFSFSTHIVGGELNYVYNGGSSYTIKLKLYKDCGSNAAGFPGSVTISVRGYNGAAFSPNKDITINLGTVTTVPSGLAPCAVAPNPMPCVQEGIYTTTVNNLPPNPGGYHLFYQVTARNLSLTNINGACNCIGESYYTNIPGTTVSSIWNENFSLPNNTTSDNGATSWSITPGATPPASAIVNNNIFEITGANNGAETWTSQVVDISSCTSVDLSVDLSENGNLDANDSISVYYRLNGGALTLFPTNGFKASDFNNAVASAAGLSGTSIQFVIRVKYDNNSPSSETYRFDNVIVSCMGNDFKINNNPVFNLFPPLFICVNQPFSFNQSATDINGDSLVYSLYTPYDGDAGTGSLDPTFTSNTAAFTPVTYLAGYSTNFPLGPTPFGINPSTGLLAGTPGTIGQFVVGVMVKEYRNGVFLSQTLRDFQFNVLNCPQPPPTLAVANTTINNGCSAKLNATGITTVSATWNSIAPGAPGAYNNLLSCTSGCLNNTVTAAGTPPAFVDYVVCGISTSCSGNYICDTFRVTFNSALAVTINPYNPILCTGQTSTTLTAIASGGTPPYSYLWNNVNPSQSINIGAGTYNVKLTDGTGCPPVYNSVVVTTYSVPTNANAGPNQTKCTQNPLATINATVTGASGGTWSGGQGTFSPNNTTLTNLFYTPSVAELAAGSASLYLTTTGNGDCPPSIDTVIINYSGFTGVVSSSITPISCFGGSNGSASINITGGSVPYTYLWNTVPTQTTSTVNNLSAGTYSVEILNGIGCTYQTTVNITEPSAPVTISSTVTNITCNGANNGSIDITANGGTSPYTYSWLPGGQTTSSVTGLSTGTYTTIVTDSKGCNITNTFTITQPTALNVMALYFNVGCFGGSNGIINSNVSGGTAPYTYNWSPGGATTPNLTGLTAGGYTLTVTDALNCSRSRTVTLLEPSPLTVTTSVINETCNNLNNGSATALPNGGGMPGYTYLWQPGNQTTATISNQASGNYTVTITDTKGCQATSIATINEPTTLTTGFINQTNVGCFNGSDGAVTANPSGGTPNYSYTWTPGNINTPTISNIAVGVYTVLVNDTKGCTTSNTVSITQPSSITVNHVSNPTSCNGGNNGSITLTPSGGTSPYSYFWLPGGQTTSSATGLSAGTYTADVTDSKGCVSTNTFTVTQPTALNVILPYFNVGCFGGSNGIINSNVSGGTAPYTYSWSPGGATTSNLTGLPAGTYTLTVKDAANCTKVRTVTLLEPSPLTVTTSVINETCNNLNNGSATALPNGGGMPGYTYLWQPGNQTTATISNQASGNYTVTITDTKGCQATSIATIGQPAILTTGFINKINVSCFNGSNGAVTANPSGGTPNYSYTWTPGNINTPTISNIAVGVYTVLVNDTKGCTTSNTVSITQPSSITVNHVSNPTSCNGGNNGSITLTPSGGTSPYSYFWLLGGQTTSSLTGLSAGTYTTIVTDSKGCVSSNAFVVTQPTALNVILPYFNVGCFGGSNGIINSNVSGGTAPYTYSWSPGGATTSNLTGLPVGTYTLTVTDAANCTKVRTVTLLEPSPLTVTTSVINETCNNLNNGSATALPNGGGMPGYTYLWQPGNQTTATISNQASGNYTVTITDTKGCQATSITTINEPTTLTTGFINQTNVSCFNGSNGAVTANPSGGTPNYSYTWTPGNSNTPTINNIAAGVYTVLVNDTKGCATSNTVSITQPSSITVNHVSNPTSCNGGNNGSISVTPNGGTAPYSYFWLPGGQTTSSATGLSAGTYTINVTDSKGCVSTKTVTVTQPPVISIVFTSTNVSCFNGNDAKINTTVSGGTAPYSYSWHPTGSTTQNINGLVSGNYTLTVTDGLNCSKTKTITLTQPTPLTVTTSVINETCNYLNNGSASSTPTGGTPGYTYLWQPGNQITATITNKSSGNYTVTITDTKGCQATSITTINEPTLLSVGFINQTNVSCFGGNDASLTSLAAGGTPNYTYTWSPGGSNTSMINNLSAGTYTVNVRDSKSCLATNTVLVTEPPVLTLISSITNVNCNGASNGAVSISPAGGTAPYIHNLMPGNIVGANFTNLTPGTYSIITTDAHGCVDNSTITINQPIDMSAVTSVTNSTCLLQNGEASISVTSGGTPPFTYNWLPAGGTASVSTNLFAGSYSITVTDANGCSSTKIVNINDITGPTVSIASSTNVSCFGGNNGAITASHTGGTGPTYTYSWSPFGGNSLTAPNLTSGVYTLKVTDDAGCIGLITSALITEPLPIGINITPTNVSCFAGNNGEASATINGGTPGYNYSWLPAATTATNVTGLAANNYTLQITDANNCIASSTFAISQPSAALSLSLTSLPVSCFGGNNGSASAVADGGTAPYNFNCIPGNINGANVSNLSAGNYTITATDIKGCSTTNTITVNEPTPIVLATGEINSNCSLANGQASVNASGGTGTYTYLWAPVGGTTAIANSLLAGSYSVTVTDANNCTAVTSQTVIDNPAPVASVATTTNVSCFGGANGLAEATVVGGSAPFTYSWLPTGGTNSTASGLSIGVYTVIVTAANGCTATAESPIITQPSQIFATITSTNVSCFGGNNGEATATINGGTPGYTYNWLPAATTATNVTGLAANNYTLQITDANNCIATSTFAINQPTAALSLSLTSLPVSCFGGNNGSASALADGGTAPYNFNCIPGNINGSNVSNLSAGNYTITATDIKGCSTSNTITVNEPTPIVLTTGEINSNCSLANGQASVNASGGTGTYTYLWAPVGGTTAIANSLLAGSYSVTVTDINNCTAVTSQTVIDNPAPVASVATTTNVSCFGGANGLAEATVVGGSAPFTYSWLPTGGTNSTASGLSIGVYTVIVTAANGCTATAESPIITQPSQIFATITSTNVSCFGGNNGEATATINGGTPGYTYNWLPAATTATNVTGLAANNYTLQITDANNCIATSTFAINQPTAALSLSLTSLPVSCFGGNNGSASALADGGTAPYNFNCIPGNINGSNVSNLSAGNYTITATDIKGCSTSNTITVNEPTPIVLTTGEINSNCSLANGQASVNASGGTGTYAYLWAPVGGTTAIANGLLAGSYSVTVTDINNCTAVTSQTVIDNPAPVASVATTTNVSCFGGANGLAEATVVGGSAPFTYSWLPTGGTNSTASGLSIGVYTVIVTAANGCTATAESPIITQPSQIFATITSTNVSCFAGNNGEASATINGGTPGYNYSWLPAATTATNVTGLAANNYTLQITDANSCIATSTFAITQPTAALAVSISSSTNVSCYGGYNGSAIASVTGGTPNYHYTWLPYGSSNNLLATGLIAGTYSVNIADIKGCVTSTTINITQPIAPLTAVSSASITSCFGGSNGTATITPSGGTSGYSYVWNPNVSSVQTASNLNPGNYSVTVTDNKGCQTNTYVSIGQPSIITGSLIANNASCGFANGSVISQISGGTAPYTYLWSPGSFTTSTISSLLPGTYSLIVTDSKNCIKTLTTSLINIPGPTISIASTTSVSCFNGNNGSATININQGTAPFTINWLPFGGNAITSTTLIAGTYTAYVTDALGCQHSTSATITQPSDINTSIDAISNVSCNGGNNGSISVSATGGTTPYLFNWLPIANGSSINNLHAGTYTLTVEDANHCNQSISVNVTEPTILSSAITNIDNPLCYSGTGNASVMVSGGTSPYAYSWNSSPIQTGNTLNNVPDGTYTVAIVDSKGCTDTITATITQPSQIITSVIANDTICLGQQGQLIASATGGVGNYYYSWQPVNAINSGTLTDNPTTNKTYTVTAFDQNGCIGTETSSKIVVYNLTSSNLVVTGTTPICPGQATSINAQTTGNTGPVTYSWNNGLGNTPGTFVLIPNQPTTYVVTVSNICGLSIKDSVQVLFNPPPTIKIWSDTLYTCAPGIINFSNQSISGNSSDPITSWQWDFGDGTFSTQPNPYHNFSSYGTYTVNLKVTTDAGCTNNTSSLPLIIHAYKSPTASFYLNLTELDLPYDELQCNNTSSDADYYNWNFGDGMTSTASDPNYLYQTIGTYDVELIASTINGCRDTAYAQVTTKADIIFPNAFTPNENGEPGEYYDIYNLTNDLFFPHSSGVVEYKLQIFNRWGELIFETMDIKQGWNGYYRGKLCEVGVYVWKAEAKFNTGKTFRKNGDVTILR